MTGVAAFDYIIVGAGTAGCLLANRLSADPRITVLMIEAGGRDRNPWIHVPAGYLYLIGNPNTDWCYHTEPEKHLGGRRLAYARGKTLGGSSAINAMIYMRGHAANYDRWMANGNDGWGWWDLLPYFLRHEDFFRPGDHHGAGGEWRVEEQRVNWPILDATLQAFVEIGLPRIDDFNTGDNFGAGYFHVSQRKGIRVSAAKAFLHPIRKRQNLTLVTHAQVTKIAVDGRQARGVCYRQGDTEHLVAATQEVILAAGAIGSPHLLELSGIGAPEHLKAAGIDVVHPLSGVGENLIDNLQIRTVFKVENALTLNTRAATLAGKLGIALEYAVKRRGPLAMAPSQAGAFLKSTTGKCEAPDLHVNVQPLSLDRFGGPLHSFPAITISVSNVQPKSRGSVHASSADWRTPPQIRANYLSEASDRTRAVEAVEVARRLMAAQALKPYRPIEYRPGAQATTATAILDAVSNIAGTLFHPCGTARMGVDSGAVVDPTLKVVGIDGLRVVDASIIPAPISGGLAAPTLMIAEKGADMILAEFDRRRTARPDVGAVAAA